MLNRLNSTQGWASRMAQNLAARKVVASPQEPVSGTFGMPGEALLALVRSGPHESIVPASFPSENRTPKTSQPLAGGFHPWAHAPVSKAAGLMVRRER